MTFLKKIFPPLQSSFYQPLQILLNEDNEGREGEVQVFYKIAENLMGE